MIRTVRPVLHSTRSVLATAATALLLSAAVTAQSNLLLIVADDLGTDQLGLYGVGATTAPTPNLDALASRGARFTQAWAHPTCSPTRAAFHTGRHPFRHGVGTALMGSDPGLPLDETTLPEALDLGASGYRHALVGKWHLGLDPVADRSTPNAAGWSHYAGSLQGAITDYQSWGRTENGVTRRSTDYATTRTVDDALAWIGGQTAPWLCVVAFNAPHTPYHEPPAALHTQQIGSNPRPVVLYRAMVEAMDTEIGRLLNGLGSDLPNTDVIFLGDNGTAGQVAQAPVERLRAKGTVYQGGVRVPMLAAGPSVQGGGRVIDAPVEVVDLFPTLLELCGVDAQSVVPAGTVLDGRSFAALLRDPAAPASRDLLYTEQSGVGIATGLAVSQSGYKLVRSIDAGVVTDELYHLAVDAWETAELLQQPLSSADQRAFEDLQIALARRREAAALIAYGQGCGVVASPNLGSSGANPVLGQTLPLAADWAVTGVAGALLLGTSRDRWGSQTLPLALDAWGFTGCSLQAAAEVSLVASGTSPTGSAWTIPVPADQSLLGEVLFAQALGLDASARSLTTPGVALLLGY